MNELDKLFQHISNKLILNNTLNTNHHHLYQYPTYHYTIHIGKKHITTYTLQFTPPNNITLGNTHHNIADPQFDIDKFTQEFETYIYNTLSQIQAYRHKKNQRQIKIINPIFSFYG